MVDDIKISTIDEVNSFVVWQWNCYIYRYNGVRYSTSLDKLWTQNTRGCRTMRVSAIVAKIFILFLYSTPTAKHKNIYSWRECPRRRHTFAILLQYRDIIFIFITFYSIYILNNSRKSNKIIFHNKNLCFCFNSTVYY